MIIYNNVIILITNKNFGLVNIGYGGLEANTGVLISS